MSRPVCAVVGVGPGNGAAFARAFAEAGYAVALLSRSLDTLEALAATLPEAAAFACDAGDPASVTAALGAAAEALGPVDVLIWNAGSGAWANPEEATLESFEASWRVNALGLLAGSQAVIPGMKAAGGAIIVVGATASLRGGANFTAFASAKAAQRNLSQSLARHLGPQGIHVALLILDGFVRTPSAVSRFPERAPETMLSTDAIAASALQLVRQDRSAWTSELDLRPFSEKW